MKVISIEKTTAPLGGSATLWCKLITPPATPSPNVLQITWRKELGNFTGTVATISKKYGQKFHGYYSKRKAQFSEVKVNSSAITISSVRLEDQGCFQCIFNVYPIGASTGTVCLDVYATSESDISGHLGIDYQRCLGEFSDSILIIYMYSSAEKVTVAEHVAYETKIYDPRLEFVVPESSKDPCVVSCSATGKPAPEITWSNMEDLEGKPHVYNIIHPNQTVTVISNVTLINSRTRNKREVTCVVNHPALRHELYISKSINDTREEEFSVDNLLIAISVLISVTLAMVGLVCYFLICGRRKKMYTTCWNPKDT
ncbi:OX-2 membrane glycoprotein [Rhinophrynus dorsalis]